MATNDPFVAIDEIPRKVLTFFYLVDTSGSMEGAKIASLNTAVRESLPIIKDISDNSSDSKIKIAVLEFSTDCQWMYPEPQDVENFVWQDLNAGGLTAMGAACRELAEKLSQSHGFMHEAAGSRAPVILLLSDGAPTDDFGSGLQKLKENKWFNVATKLAIAIGNDAINETLINFTGNSECVMTVHTIDQLKNLIRFVSVTASRVNSKTTSVGTESDDKAKETATAITEAIKNDPTLTGIDVGTDAQTSGKTDDWTGW
ncbi:MAG: VWA domain-containing protein [Bacteroidales bacterium]|nr:VWA domain-containing protein [Bacteroidales bacterium]